MALYLNWLTIGAFLAILELVMPGTYLIWFGLAALVMSAITFVEPDISMLWQLIWLGILSVGFALIGWRVYGKLIFKVNMPEEYRKLNNPIAQLKGKQVEVVGVKGDKLQVSVGDTVWSATSKDKIKKGDQVVIEGSSNNVELIVKKILDKNIKKK